jgi:cell division septation protein DedD
MPRNGMEDAPPALAPEASRSWPRWLTWVGVGFSLVLLLRVVSGRIFPLQTSAYLANLNVGDSPPSIEQQKREPERPESTPPSQDLSALQATKPQTEGPREESPKPVPPPQASDFQAAQGEGQLVTIARGDTISAIVLKMYGTYNVLAFDLLKECNPHIEDLDRIAIGTQVWLPLLTRELLLRQQADGSYHLIIGAFHMEAAAQRVVQAASRAGYAATITQRRMSGTRLLHRVELERLQDLTAVDHAWNVVVKGKM